MVFEALVGPELKPGEDYKLAEGPTQMKILFDEPEKLEVFQSDILGTAINENTSEDDVKEAKQAICGKLFKELWSDDVTNGFPLPRGCYYRVYKTGNARVELYLVFEPKNGLAPGTNYQIVMNGIATKIAKPGERYVQIFTMDDIEVFFAVLHS